MHVGAGRFAVPPSTVLSMGEITRKLAVTQEEMDRAYMGSNTGAGPVSVCARKNRSSTASALKNDLQ